MGGPGFVVEHAHFAEEIAVAEHRQDDLAPVLGDQHHLDLAVRHHVEGVARVVPEDDHGTLRVASFADQAGKRRQVGLGQAAEERDAAQDVDGRKVHGGVRRMVMDVT